MTLEAPTIIILTTLDNICSTGITYNHHLQSSKYFFMVQATGLSVEYSCYSGSRVIREMLQVVASPMTTILMTLYSHTIIILNTLENIYGTGITYNHHLWSSKYFFMVQATVEYSCYSASRVIRKMLQVVASLMIIILMTPGAPTSIILTTLENITVEASLTIVTYNRKNIFLWYRPLDCL